MTEQTSELSPRGDRWPQTRRETADPAVNTVLKPLGTLADLPIPNHQSVYTALHDGLLAELNADPAEER